MNAETIFFLQDFNVTVQKFRVASNHQEAEGIPKEFPCHEYVIKAQVLAGGRGKGHFDNGFKVSVNICSYQIVIGCWLAPVSLSLSNNISLCKIWRC
jgi:succinyl-CoA synthetase beta subunit